MTEAGPPPEAPQDLASGPFSPLAPRPVAVVPATGYSGHMPTIHSISTDISKASVSLE